jgi:hypothetical protein
MIEENKSQNLTNGENQNTSDDSIASGFLKYKDNIETVSKGIIALIAIAYVVGLLILNTHLRNFGIRYLSFLQVEYVLVGMLCLFLTITTYLSGAVIYRQIKCLCSEKKERSRSIFVSFIILITLLVYWLIMFGFVVDFDFRVIDLPGLVVVLVLLVNAFGMNSVVILSKSDFSKYLNVSKNHILYKFSLILFSVVALTIGIASYANFVFPKLTSAYGGGKKQIIQLLVNAEFIPEIKNIGLRINDETKKSEKLELILETDDAYFISPPIENSDGQHIKAIRINKDEIDVVLFLSNRTVKTENNEDINNQTDEIKTTSNTQVNNPENKPSNLESK